MGEPEIRKFSPPSVPPHGEMMFTVKKEVNEFKDIGNLLGTEAGKKARELDAADGKVDGKISANVWNAYAGAHGGKPIKNEIGLVDAMNSITSYTVKEQAAAKNAPKPEAAEE